VYILFFSYHLIQSNYERATGLDFDIDEYKKLPLKVFQYKSLENPSPQISLKNYVPIVGNQGEIPNCSTWSISYYARSILENIQSNNSTKNDPFSPNFLYFLSKNKNQEPCDKGRSIEKVLDVLKDKGTISSNMFKESCDSFSSVNESIFSISKNYRVKSFTRLQDKEVSSPEQNIAKIKLSLSNKRPVVFGMYCCEESFLKLKEPLWTPKEGITKKSAHAMTIIGYDDNKYGGAFEVVNSWGESWGDKGFFWITYKEFSKRSLGAYEIIEGKKEIIKGENISIKIDLEKVNDKSIIPLKYLDGVYYSEKSYKSGDKFRIKLKTQGSMYAYVFGYDTAGTQYKLFPPQYKGETGVSNVSPELNYKVNDVILPNPDTPKDYILVDNNIGTDYVFFLFSKEEINIDKIMTILKRYDSSSQTKITKAIADISRVKKDFSSNNNNTVDLNTYLDGTDIISVIMELNHEVRSEK
jgi:hypothetical protein